jgi:hypothetical protein
VVKFTPQLLYTGKESLYPLNRRLVALQRWSGCFGEERNALLLPRFESHIIQLILRNYTD